MAFEVRGVAPLFSVYDMPESVRFYRDVLGFELVSTSPNRGGEDRFHWALLRLGDAEVMLNTGWEFDEERPAERVPDWVAAHADATLYFGCPDVDAAYEELRGRMPSLKPPTVAQYGMKQLGMRDPDGYGLVFQWRASE